MYDIFQLKPFTFPQNFIFGSATAGHQIEGDNIHSGLWRMEQQWSKDDLFHCPSGKACNHYQMYREDIDLLSELEHQMFRLSVEWARIEPEEGHFDQKEADHYIDELSCLKEKGIQVMVTVVHGTVPAWFDDKGGFKRENLSCFEKYLNYIIPQIAPYVDMWNVLNEYNMGLDMFDPTFFHALGYHTIKKYSSKPVSTAHAMVMPYPKRYYDPFDRALAQYRDVCTNEFFFHAIRTGEVIAVGEKSEFNRDVKDTCDFWSINFYTRSMVDARKKGGNGTRFDHKYLRMIDMDFYLEEFYPEQAYHNLTRLSDKPVMISENGLSCDDDRFRIVFLAQYLSCIHEAMQAGVDVRGYLYWSFLDNYEWGSYLPRFGMVDVDFDTFRRTPKPSAYFYRDIIRANGFNQDILRRYLTEMPRLPEGANK